MVLYIIGNVLVLIGTIFSFFLTRTMLFSAYILVFVGWLFTVSSHPLSSEMELLEKAKQQIEQCEKELPRNQQCELKAVPKI